MDWDLWPAIIRHGRATATFDDMAAHLATISHEVDEMAAAIGRALQPIIDQLAADLRAVLW